MSLPNLLRRAAARAWIELLLEGAPPARRGDALILNYHRVAVDPDDRWKLSVSPRAFEAQMLLIRDKARPLSLGGLIELRDRGEPVPPGTVVITFDDGFRDNVDEALPILERLGLLATFFLCTGFLDRRAEFYWSARGEAMSWSEAERIVAAGGEIGAHSVSHPHLAGLEPARVAEEIESSRERIRAVLGIEPRDFAYPFGGPEDTAAGRTFVARAGFRAACSTRRGASPKDDDRFALRRMPVGDWNANEFALRVLREFRIRTP